MARDLLSILLSCLCCCIIPEKKSKREGSTHRVAHYNAQLRASLGLPERHLELPPPILAGLNTRQQSESHNSHYTVSTNATEAVPPTEHGHLQKGKSPRVRFSANTTTTQSQSQSGTGAGTIGYSTAIMDRKELSELFNRLHETLEHVPYAICGLGALIDHGFTRRRANKISIICPQECKNNIKAWAAARGYETFVDSIGIPTHHHQQQQALSRDGGKGRSLAEGAERLRKVRIKFIDSGFERLEIKRSSISNAVVLSMTSQLDNVAAGYLYHRRRGDERACKIIVSDVFWCLERVASSPRERLDPDFLPTFLGEEFFADFTAMNPTARVEMERAGIDVDAVLAKHHDAAALREHNEMLKQYGLEGDVVAPNPGAFEGVRDLTNSKSVYTLKDRNSHVSSNA